MSRPRTPAIVVVARSANPTVQASWDADAAWQAEINATYGVRAGNAARWDARGTATPALAALYAERLAAMDAEHAMWEAYRADAVKVRAA